MKVQAALLTPDEVEELAEALSVLKTATEGTAWFVGREKVERAVELLANVLTAK